MPRGGTKVLDLRYTDGFLRSIEGSQIRRAQPRFAGVKNKQRASLHPEFTLVFGAQIFVRTVGTCPCRYCWSTVCVSGGGEFRADVESNRTQSVQ